MNTCTDVVFGGCLASRKNPSGCGVRCRSKQLLAVRRLKMALKGVARTYRCSFDRVKPFKTRGDCVYFWKNLSGWIKGLLDIHVDSFFPCRVPLRVRRSFVFSLSLLGKVLPDPCACYMSTFSSEKFAANLAKGDTVTHEYLGFVGQVALKLFRPGWDRSYHSHCFSASVSTSSCFERGRKKGGCLGGLGRSGQSSYLDRVMDGGDFSGIDCRGRFTAVPTKGKVRPLTMMSEMQEYLRPLHKTMYGFLASMPWLLRGTPTVERLAQLIPGDGDFLSIDFTASTDNLSINCAERILGIALNATRNVPAGLKEFALRSLRPHISMGIDDPEPVVVGNSQLMGSLLSFPLLCVQTLAFCLWSSGVDISDIDFRKYSAVLVNGDDAVLRSSRPDEFFRLGGLTPSILNPVKTGRSSRWLNINSTLFYLSSGGGEFVPAPFVRPAQFVFESPRGLGKVVAEIVKPFWSGDRARIMKFLLEDAFCFLRQCGRSFYYAGFRGREFTRYFNDRYYQYEKVCRVGRDEAEWPEPVRDLKEAMVEAPAIFNAGFTKTLCSVYNSWRRFTIVDPKPAEKLTEKRIFDAVWDWRWAVRERKRRVEKWGRLVNMVWAEWHQGTLFRSKRALRRHVMGGFTEDVVKKNLLPEGLVGMLAGLEPGVSIDRRVIAHIFRCFDSSLKALPAPARSLFG